MKKIIRLAVLAILTTSLFVGMMNATAQDDHDEHDNPESTCSEPDKMVPITTHASDLSFNTTEIQVEKGSCVMFMFMNMQDIEHDFVLNNADGTEELFGLHLLNSTSGMKSVMYQMPDEDTELPFWCTVAGHKEQGMEGVVIVGNGNSVLPGFEFVYVFAAFAISIPILRRFRR